jgi:hypothetical protein
MLCALALAACACGGGSATTAPHIQAGEVAVTTGPGSLGRTVGFVFRPDGAPARQSGSATGTRALQWSDVTPWAVCGRRGRDCRWFETDTPPRCMRVGARVQVGWVDTKPVDEAPGSQLLAWVKCLAPS